MAMEVLVMETKRVEEEEDSSDNKYYMKGVMHLCERGVTRIPHKYILPISQRPSTDEGNEKTTAFVGLGLKLPIIDISLLNTPNRAQVLDSLAEACRDYGFFQVVNHGISSDITGGVMDVGKRFFEELPKGKREKYMSADIFSPVRYGTSFNQSKDGVFCWRDFLKLSCHPLPLLLPSWPSSPGDLRQGASQYAREARSLFLVLMGAILETLGLSTNSSKPMLRDFEEGGTQMMMVNYYPTCPDPNLTLGMPPHSDYGFLTLLLQDDVSGLQVHFDDGGGGRWVTVEPIPGALVVNAGDHLEIFSNGRYKSALHRVLVNSRKPRMSVASLLSLPAHSVVSPSPHLVDEAHPRRYMDTSFAAFLDFLCSHETQNKSFIQTRKLKEKAQT